MPMYKKVLCAPDVPPVEKMPGPLHSLFSEAFAALKGGIIIIYQMDQRFYIKFL